MIMKSMFAKRKIEIYEKNKSGRRRKNVNNLNQNYIAIEDWEVDLGPLAPFFLFLFARFSRLIIAAVIVAVISRWFCLVVAVIVVIIRLVVNFSCVVLRTHINLLTIMPWKNITTNQIQCEPRFENRDQWIMQDEKEKVNWTKRTIL